MILVTGATGLVGSNLLYHLVVENEMVLAFYRSKTKIEVVKKIFLTYSNDGLKYFEKIKWIKADITDIPLLETIFSSEKITQVYHCAALISFNPKDYSKMRSINIDGTANLVNFCVEYRVQKFCYVSSIAAIGDSIDNKPISEENEWNEEIEKSGYAITKFGGEMEVWRASQEGLEVVIVNPGVILGTGFKDGSSKMFSQIKNGFRFYTEGITGFVGVTDVVKVMMKLMSSDIKNERFILVSENKSFKEIFFMIADAFNVKRPNIKIGKLITTIFWRINWILTKLTNKQPVLTKNTAKSMHNKEFYTSNKIKNTLNYNFQPLNTVIKNTCKSYFI